jgi:hypothetical protein
MGDLAIVLQWVLTIALAISLAAAAGLRAWLPLLVAGVLGKLGVADLGASFEWLASWPAIGLFGVATVVEILGDKVPALDHTLDAMGTFVRPAAGALVAAAVLVRIDDPLYATVAGLAVGVPSSLAPHAAKASARAVSSATTFGFANPVLSFLEDFLALGIAILAFAVPALTLVAIVLLAYSAWRWIRRRRPPASPQLEPSPS